MKEEKISNNTNRERQIEVFDKRNRDAAL